MTQEQKDLLLKDLCARLTYGVRCSFGVDDAIYIIEGINPNCCGASEIQATHLKSGINGDFKINACKPYLFPLSSMTEEQREEFDEIIGIALKDLESDEQFSCMGTIAEVNFYHKYHFDYCGLIPMGLANDATNLNIY